MVLIKIKMQFFVIMFFVVCLVGLVSGEDFKISGVSPDKKVVSLLVDEERTFSINNEIDSSINWYLDGDLVLDGWNEFKFEATDSGIYKIRVDVVKADIGDSYLWDIIVIGDKRIENKTGLNWGTIVFYAIVTVLLIIIFLVVRLFILEKKGEMGGGEKKDESNGKKDLEKKGEVEKNPKKKKIV